MTSTPTPNDRESGEFGAAEHDSQPTGSRSAGGFSAATVEALVRYDEASPEDLALLEREPGAAAVLAKLREVDAQLESGAFRMGATGPMGSTGNVVSSEALFAFGHGELAQDEAEVVREHLAQTPQESAWVEALRSSPPPATLTWDAPDAGDTGNIRDTGANNTEVDAEASPILAGPGSQSVPSVGKTDEAHSKPNFPSWLAWTPLAAAALILAMAIGGTGQRSVLDGGLPNSPIMRSAATSTLLFPRGRVIASTATVRTYASNPLFEVSPVEGASHYGFELRKVTGQNAFAEGEVVWESTAASHEASAPELAPGKYTWTATAEVQGIDRVLGSLSFTVVPARAVDRALFVRAATGQSVTMPGILREDIRRLHASGFLTDARSKARALPQGEERDRYLAIR